MGRPSGRTEAYGNRLPSLPLQLPPVGARDPIRRPCAPLTTEQSGVGLGLTAGFGPSITTVRLDVLARDERLSIRGSHVTGLLLGRSVTNSFEALARSTWTRSGPSWVLPNPIVPILAWNNGTLTPKSCSAS